jgi:hypothetical protein
MRRPLASLALCGLLAAAPATADEEVAGEHEAHERAEAGRRQAADAVLLEEARGLDEAVLVGRARITRLQARARTEDLVARLEEAADRPGAEAARQRLLSAWAASAEAVTRWWPVSAVRVCSYERLHLESALGDDDPARRGATLGEARSRLRRCVDGARRVSDALDRAAGELEEALRSAHAALAPAGG